MQQPFVVAICPTKGRPVLIPNVLKMWEQQSYPAEDRQLLIWDDQPNFDSCTGKNWELTAFRSGLWKHISMKYHDMVMHAAQVWQPDIIAIWEDDDIYLRDHISTGVRCMRETGCPVVRNNIVWTDHPGGKGVMRLFVANAAYHGSWMFTPQAYDRSGGYRNEPCQHFDTGFCSRLSSVCQVHGISSSGFPDNAWRPEFPTYGYRFGTTGYHNASQFGLDFQIPYGISHSDTEIYPTPGPQFDSDTELLWNLPSGTIPPHILSDPESVRNGLLI